MCSNYIQELHCELILVFDRANNSLKSFWIKLLTLITTANIAHNKDYTCLNTLLCHLTTLPSLCTYIPYYRISFCSCFNPFPCQVTIVMLIRLSESSWIYHVLIWTIRTGLNANVLVSLQITIFRTNNNLAGIHSEDQYKSWIRIPDRLLLALKMVLCNGDRNVGIKFWT